MRYNNDIYSVVEFLHVKPGKGAAFVRTKLKSMTTGKVVENTFPAGHKIDVVRVERRPCQFLYKDDMGYHFMDNETFEQISLKDSLLDNPELMKEGSTIDVLFDGAENVPMTAEMPQYIELEVTYTEPGGSGRYRHQCYQACHR